MSRSLSPACPELVVLGAGLSRSQHDHGPLRILQTDIHLCVLAVAGTLSLSMALEILGLPCHHMMKVGNRCRSHYNDLGEY